jgi:hypothetical protein
MDQREETGLEKKILVGERFSAPVQNGQLPTQPPVQ